MKKAALTVATLVASFTAAPALSADHTTTGTPGAPNCAGQTTAALAQVGKNAGVQDARGLGQLAHYLTANGSPTTVQDVHAAIDAFCAG